MITAIIIYVFAYCVGSLSSAIIVCKLFKLPDPRTDGSKNPGTTNVLRLGGKLPAIITLSGDMLKGFLPVLIASFLGMSGFFLGLVALAAFLGHLFPVFFKFQGGKGVATAFGAYLALSPFTGAIIILCWILVAAISRYSSLAAIVAVTLAPVWMLLFANKGYFFALYITTGLLLWRHLDNIIRLRAGTERKIELKSLK